MVAAHLVNEYRARLPCSAWEPSSSDSLGMHSHEREAVAKKTKHLVPMLCVGMHTLEYSKG